MKAAEAAIADEIFIHFDLDGLMSEIMALTE